MGTSGVGVDYEFIGSVAEAWIGGSSLTVYGVFRWALNRPIMHICQSTDSQGWAGQDAPPTM